MFARQPILGRLLVEKSGHVFDFPAGTMACDLPVSRGDFLGFENDGSASHPRNTPKPLRATLPKSAIKGQSFAPPFDRLASGQQHFLECRAFQTVEVAFASRRLLKDMLRQVTDFRIRKRRSVTTSFNACRMTATVEASYFCFRSIIMAASIVGRVLERDDGADYPHPSRRSC